MSRVIGIVSGKGGVGKTVITANIGMALHELGHNVTLVDADLNSPNLGLHLGLYSSHNNSLQKALRGEVKPDKSIYIHPSGLKLMPSSLAFDYVDVDDKTLSDLFHRLRGLVIVDSPSGLGNQGLVVLRSCDDIIIVTNPEIPAVTDAMRVIEVAREYGKNLVGVVVNKKLKAKGNLTAEEISEATELPVIAEIPMDYNIHQSINSKLPVIHHRPYCSSSLKFRKLAADLVGAPYISPKFPKIKDLFLRPRKLAVASDSGYPTENYINEPVQSFSRIESNANPFSEEYSNPPINDVNKTVETAESAQQSIINTKFRSFDDIIDNDQDTIDKKSEQELTVSDAKIRKKRGPGRPKGSVSKKKSKRGPGRPKGSVSKKKSKRGPGRPKGSTKNKRGPGRPKGSTRKKK